jgi:hypothetical protein
MQGLRAACLLWVINTSRDVRVMSVIPLKADIHLRGLHVCLVPEADITSLSGYALRLVEPLSQRQFKGAMQHAGNSGSGQLISPG